jgi:predicted RND superfamily exporter protein
MRSGVRLSSGLRQIKMRSGFTQSILAFARAHRTLVFAIAAAAAILGAVLVSRVRFDADVLRLLPQRSAPVRDFEAFLREFGSLDHLYLVFDADDGIGGHADLVDAYVDRLRRAPEVQDVDTQVFEPGRDWGYLADRELFLLGADAAGDALARLRPPRLDAELAHARDLLSMPSAGIKGLVQQDPLGLLDALRDRMGKQHGFVAFNPGEDGYVSRDGRSRLVIVKPAGAPFDTGFCQALFARLAAIEADTRKAVPPEPEAAPVRIQAAGAYRVSLEAERLIRREGVTNAVGSLAGLLLVVFAVFRTPRVMLYGFAPLAIAALLTLGVNGLASGSLSPATSGSAGMLFGLGIDGVVLLYLRFLEECRTGRTADEAVARLGPTASSVVLAQLTTAATFLALLFIDFPTLQDLGGLVGLGILLCCVLTLLLLPALIPRGSARFSRGLTMAWLGRLVERAAIPIVVVSAAATLVLGIAATRLRLDPTLERLQAQTRGAALEREVAQRFGLPQDILVVLGRNDRLEPLLQSGERLSTALAAYAPGVSPSGIGFLLPSAREQDRVATAIRAAGLTAADVTRDLESAAARAGFKAGAFVPFEQRVSRLLDPSARITYDGLIDHGLAPVVSRFLVHRNGLYESAQYLYATAPVDIDALDQLVRAVDPALHLTGLPAINHDLRLRFFRQFVQGVAIGALAVAALIYAVFRTIRQTVLALAPTAVGFVWSAGILALAGVTLDLFSLFAAVTFIGIAVDYGIYVLYRYTFEPSGGMASVVTQTGAAIALACGTALIGFGSLVNSSYAPLHVFGIMSIVTLGCCLLASIVTLPAVVISVERWSRSRR